MAELDWMFLTWIATLVVAWGGGYLHHKVAAEIRETRRKQ